MQLRQNIKIISVLFVSTFSVNSFSCDIDFDGSLFLKESYSKGASPQSTCHTANAIENKFYAFPDKTCDVIFNNNGWLTQGWSFKGIQGGGTFKVHKTASSITIVLQAAGGFKLKKVTLHSNKDNCDHITLAKVL